MLLSFKTIRIVKLPKVHMFKTYLYLEICALLGYYEAPCGNCLPTFRDNVSVPSSRVKSPSRKERKSGTYNADSGKYGGVAISRRDDSQ
jgi:hypothetical protein